ncbi:MAG: zf-HC2 domain-containing protein [Terriglobia bacterium]
MNREIHERARRLIDAWQVEGISAPDREWLDAHLAECSSCQARVRANDRALQALRSNSISVSPALVSTTQARVRLRARQLQENQARLRALWVSCGLSWLMGTLTAPLLWEAIAWLGRRFEISEAIWVAAFAVCWVAPASLVAAVMAWKYSQASAGGNSRGVWER